MNEWMDESNGKTSIKQPPLENRKFFRVVTFRNSFLFGGRIV